MKSPRWLQVLSAYWAVICSTAGFCFFIFNWGKNIDTTVLAHAQELKEIKAQANLDHDELIEYRSDVKSIKTDVAYIKSKI